MGENPLNEVVGEVDNGAIKGIADALKKVSSSGSTEEIDLSGVGEGQTSGSGSTFKVAGTNLPAKPSVWTKVRNALCYEIKVELTPYQQKIEDEINEFLHQEVTWQSFKSFLLKEVPITYKGKRIF